MEMMRNMIMGQTLKTYIYHTYMTYSRFKRHAKNIEKTDNL